MSLSGNSASHPRVVTPGVQVFQRACRLGVKAMQQACSTWAGIDEFFTKFSGIRFNRRKHGGWSHCTSSPPGRAIQLASLLSKSMCYRNMLMRCQLWWARESVDVAKHLIGAKSSAVLPQLRKVSLLPFLPPPVRVALPEGGTPCSFLIHACSRTLGCWAISPCASCC